MIFDDIFDRIDEWLMWGGKPPEKVRKARENLDKAREEFRRATREAWEEQLEKGENALALPSTAMAISLGGSEQEFQASVERLARARPRAKVQATNVQLPNGGFYRSVRIEEKG